jgi:hypothetical protein
MRKYLRNCPGARGTCGGKPYPTERNRKESRKIRSRSEESEIKERRKRSFNPFMQRGVSAIKRNQGIRGRVEVIFY